MTKEAGIGMTSFTIDDGGTTGRDIVNDITNFNLSTPRGVQDVTGVDSTAMERLLLLADCSGTISGVFNDGTNASHDVFSDVMDPSGDVTRTMVAVHSAQTFTAEVWFTDYNLTRGQDGSLTWSNPYVNADGSVPAWS